MKAVLPTKKLYQALQQCSAVVSTKTPLPILSHVLMEFSQGDVCTIQGTDGVVFFKTTIPAEVQRAGAFTVQHKDFCDIVKAFPSESLTLELSAADSKYQLLVTGTKVKYKLLTLPPDDFPSLANMQAADPFFLPIPALKVGLAGVQFAVSQEESRPNLCGLYFHNKEDDLKALRLVATDGHRLSLMEIALQAEFQGQGLLSRELLKVLGKAWEGMQEQAIFRSQNQRVEFADPFGEIQVQGLLLEGHFPNYESIFPAEYKALYKLGRVELLEACQRVSLMAEEKHGVVVFSTEHTGPDTYLSLRSSCPLKGDATQTLELRDTSNAIVECSDVAVIPDRKFELHVGFFAKYLIEALKVMDTDQVFLAFAGNQHPCLLMPVLPEDTSNVLYTRQQHLIMPVRFDR